jgi:CRP-like cAMP-binding protein/Fe-S-cluster-containing dehydrogenase component
MSQGPATVSDVLFEDEEGLFARDVDGHLVRIDKVTAADFETDITLKIDGQDVTVKKAVPATDAQGIILKDDKGLAVPRPTTIYDAASQLFGNSSGGNPIPILCHRDHMNPVAVCRLCVVEISKVKRGRRQTERKLLPACQHRVEETMEVQTIESPNDPAAGERVRSAVKILAELLMADHPSPCAKETQTGDCELEALSRKLSVGPPRFPSRPATRGRDDSSLVIAVDHNACILCDRCVRGCNDIRDNQVIGRMAKGYEAKIAFDLDQPMGGSSCVACGECMVSCPTGALTHRSVIEASPWKDVKPQPDVVSAAELTTHPLPDIRRAFSGVSPPFLQWNARAVVRRHYKKGDVICREGAFESTAFLIEKGSVEVSIQSPQKHVSDKVSGGLFKRFTSRLLSRDDEKREEEGSRASIPIDAPVDLPYARPIASMGVGDLFGEMTCMNFYPRSATVRASEDCTLLEMLRNVLYIMQRSPSFRAVLERNYRERAINNHLRSVPLFAPLRQDEARFEQFVNELRPKVFLRRCEPGEVIIRQGALADDGFYLVRTGFVKVSQSRPGGEHVLNYVGPGGYFGEVGVLSDLPEIRARATPGVRTATCTALDHVDLVRITARDFRDIINRFPDSLRKTLIESALKALDNNGEAARQAQTDSLEAFLGQGLMNAQSLLVLDLEKCTRCDECTKACSDTHQGVTRLIREGLRYDKFLVASSCRSCLDPYCMVGCPVSAIRRRDSREILIEDWCIGCGKCAENCPYGNINMHPFPTNEKAPDPNNPNRTLAVVRQKATMCDLCHDLGPNAEPSCVYACPHDAAHRMSGADLRVLAMKSPQS